MGPVVVLRKGKCNSEAMASFARIPKEFTVIGYGHPYASSLAASVGWRPKEGEARRRPYSEGTGMGALPHARAEPESGSHRAARDPSGGRFAR
jgi:hypothetical protein